MKKDEMQVHRSQYLRLVSVASVAERSGHYRDAIRDARAAWPHIDGMLQFDRRFEDRTHKTLEAVDVVLRCGPVLLDHRSLDAVGVLLTECKRIERETGGYSDALAAAKSRLGENHRLWSWLYQNGEVVQSDLRGQLGGNQDAWRATIDTWTAMGLVYRTPMQRSCVVGLTTRLGQVVPAKCPECGLVVDAPKSMFFEPLACTACGSESYFVIIAAST